MKSVKIKIYRPLNSFVVDEEWDTSVVTVRRVGSEHPTAVEGCRYLSEALRVMESMQRLSTAMYSVTGIKQIEWVDQPAIKETVE